MATIWCVLPTLNEAPSLAGLIPALLALDPDLHILGVDDQSTDGTAVLWTQWHRACPTRVQWIDRPAPLGLGSAYRQAFQDSRLQAADWVIQMDADGSHTLTDVQALLTLARADPTLDLCLGSRYVPGGRTPGWARWRRGLSRAGSAYARQILGLPVHDLTSGLKVWRGAWMQRMPWDVCADHGYGFQIAATGWALALGARWVEWPIGFQPRQFGTSKLSGRIIREAWGTPWRVRHAIAHPAEPSGRLAASREGVRRD